MMTELGTDSDQTTGLRAAAKGSAGRAIAFRFIPAIDTDPGNISFAQTKLGKLTLVSLFAVGFYFIERSFWDTSALVATLLAAGFLPYYRRKIVTIATVCWLFVSMPAWFDWTVPRYIAERYQVAIALDFRTLERLAILVVLTLCSLILLITYRHSKWRLARAPVLTLAVPYFGLLTLACYGLRGKAAVVAWSLVVTAGAFFGSWDTPCSISKIRTGTR